MKQIYKKIIVGVALLAMPLALPLTVNAHEVSDTDTTMQRPPEKRSEAQRQETKKAEQERTEAKKAEMSDDSSRKQEMRAESRQKLDDTKRRVCERHQKTINNLITRVLGAREKQIAHIDEIASRVQAYYVKNELTVDNYDVLVADVAAKKAAADAAIADAKPEAPFSCDGEGPKAELQEFRDKRDSAVEAIREYRTSVKNLIKAVKEAKKATNEESNNE